jgi:hypothetical protein
MAKFKAAGSRKSSGTARSNLALVPCLLLVLTAAAILSFLFYEILKQGS